MKLGKYTEADVMHRLGFELEKAGFSVAFEVRTPSGRADVAVYNKSTREILCFVEVKRTERAKSRGVRSEKMRKYSTYAPATTCLGFSDIPQVVELVKLRFSHTLS